MKKVLITGILIFSVIISNAAQACKCKPQSTEDRIANSDAIFTGKVTEINPGKKEVEIKLKVINSWKGGNPEYIKVYTKVLATEMCGYPFKLNDEYLIYSKKSEGKLTTGYCHNVQLISSSRQDRKALDYYKDTGKYIEPACHSKNDSSKNATGYQGTIVSIEEVSSPKNTVYNGLLELKLDKLWAEKEKNQNIRVLIKTKYLSTLKIGNSIHLYTKGKIDYKGKEVLTQYGCEIK